MKILYLTNNRFPTEKAHGLQIAKMCDAFIDMGASLLLVIPARRQSPFVKENDISRFYSLKNKIKIERLWSLDFLLSSVMPRLMAYFIQSLSFSFSFLFARRKYKNFIIYSRTIAPLIFYKSKWFFEAHTFPKTLIGKSLQRFFLKNCSGIVCISDSLKRKYATIFKGKIIVAHDGVDKMFFNIKESKNRKKMILYTGSPYAWKGVFTLADATKNLKNVRIVFLGGNENEPEFKKLKSYAKHASVLPFVPHEKVKEYLESAEILVIPNSAMDKIASEDSSPLKLFEYMAGGKKIVASDVHSIKEVLNEKMAYFFKADNVSDLQKAILRALKEKNTKGTIARKKAWDYTWDKRAKIIIGFLQKNA